MLNVSEIFRSIEGEVNPLGQGTLTTFIRLQGCNLSPTFCPWCDTKHAQNPNIIKNELSIEDILKIIPEGKITITGGEPLLQNETPMLIEALLNADHIISVETNGSMPIPNIMSSTSLSWIIDYKLHFQDQMYIDNFWDTTSQDWVKFIIENKSDFQKAVDVYLALKDGGCKARIAFSPIVKNNIPKWEIKNSTQWLAGQLIKKQLWDITLNLQIHKLIWPDEPEGTSLL